MEHTRNLWYVFNQTNQLCFMLEVLKACWNHNSYVLQNTIYGRNIQCANDHKNVTFKNNSHDEDFDLLVQYNISFEVEYFHLFKA